MTKIMLEVNLTQQEATRIAKALRHFAYNQRYPNDEQDLTHCARIIEDIACALFDKEQEDGEYS